MTGTSQQRRDRSAAVAAERERVAALIAGQAAKGAGPRMPRDAKPAVAAALAAASVPWSGIARLLGVSDTTAKTMAEEASRRPEPVIRRHADHDPSLICRPALGYGLCEVLGGEGRSDGEEGPGDG